MTERPQEELDPGEVLPDTKGGGPEVCPECGGTGFVGPEPCEACDGTGGIEENP